MNFARMIANMRVRDETIHMGTVISPGDALSDADLMAMRVEGMSCNDAQFMIQSIHILSVAVFPSDFSESFFMAFIPRGVAAFESPIIFAARFVLIKFSSSEFFPIPLKTFLIKGDKIREITPVSPLFFATSINPDHITITAPVLSINSTEVFPDSKSDVTVSSTVPAKNEYVKEEIKITVQITLSI